MTSYYGEEMDARWGDREYQVIAEGLEWEDTEGRTTWYYDESQDVADRVRAQGYDPVEVI